MPIVIPIRSSTYGDAAWTEDIDIWRKYVLAQFHTGTDFTWVKETRDFLGLSELKYHDVIKNRPRLCADPGRWESIRRGVQQASLVVIDTGEVNQQIQRQAIRDGDDFLGFEMRPGGMQDLAEQCAAAIVGSTPIAYLPAKLVALTDSSMVSSRSLERFSPVHLRDTIGPSLRHARVFAARAHAMFDVASAESAVATTCETFNSPLSRVILSELLSTQRAFDVELPRSIELLNVAAQEIAACMSINAKEVVTAAPDLVVEGSSQSFDELQAADVASGWARSLIGLSFDHRTVAGFRRVWVNGRRLASAN